MQERTSLEDSLTAIGRIEQELDDQIMLIELGESENDAGVIGVPNEEWGEEVVTSGAKPTPRAATPSAAPAAATRRET